MSRGKHDRPVEQLRTTWTSTEDLEETLALMLNPCAVPAPPPTANLTGGGTSNDDAIPCPPSEIQSDPPDTLASDIKTSKVTAPVNMSGAPPARLRIVPPANLTAPPPDTLTAGPPDTLRAAPVTGAYQALDGALVDSKYIRSYRFVQDAHTASEHIVYTTMYKMAGGGSADGSSREAIIPMQMVAAKTAISIRNLRRILRSLESKLAIDVTEYEDKTKSIPRRYRIWNMNAILERRRQMGYHFVYRNRNLVTLARSLDETPAVKLTGGAPDKLPPGSPDRLPVPSPDKQAARPPDKLTAFIENDERNWKETSSSIVSALREHFGYVDDNAIRRIVDDCRRRAADATGEEIATFVRLTAGRICKMTGLTNPVGMLITQVPKCFEGESFRQFRELERQRREAEARQGAELRADAERILADPAAEEPEKQWARMILETQQ